jgi:hypothetical protein
MDSRSEDEIASVSGPLTFGTNGRRITNPKPSQGDLPVTPEVERVIRERLETFDEDAKAARLWEDVLADLKARRPLPPSPR